MILRTDTELCDSMKVVREYCRIGHAIRKKHKIPVSILLQEVQFNGCETENDKGNFLFIEEYNLIKEELNCWNINPFFCFKEGENWEIVDEGDFKLALRLDISEQSMRDYNLSRERRKKIEANKKNGVFDTKL